MDAFNKIKASYDNYTDIYTDGSKYGDKVGAAAVIGDHILQRRLPDKCSIFSTESKAILLALEYIRVSWKTEFIIFSDSLSVLQALRSIKVENLLILQAIEEYTNILSAGN